MLTVVGSGPWGQSIFVLWIPDNQHRCSGISVLVDLGLAVLRLVGGPIAHQVFARFGLGYMLVAVAWI
jgi:hypothetical protein